MAIEAFYFTHDYNSRADGKMVTLRMKEGMAGIGLYWCIVEMLYEDGGYLLLSECQRIAFDLRVREALVRRIITDYDLFRSDSLKFWSESVLKRMKVRNDKSDKARESALERWNKRKNNTIAMRSHSDGNAIKERRGEEIKGKETADAQILGLLPFESIDFSIAWNEWLQFRKEIKKKMTPKSAEKQLNFLGARPELEAIAIINQSIQNGWTGLFDIKHQTNGTNGNGLNKNQQHTASLIADFAERHGSKNNQT